MSLHDIVHCIRGIVHGPPRIHYLWMNTHKKGYRISNNKPLPLHNGLLHSISCIFDTYQAINEIDQSFLIVGQV